MILSHFFYFAPSLLRDLEYPRLGSLTLQTPSSRDLPISATCLPLTLMVPHNLRNQPRYRVSQARDSRHLVLGTFLTRSRWAISVNNTMALIDLYQCSVPPELRTSRCSCRNLLTPPQDPTILGTSRIPRGFLVVRPLLDDSCKMKQALPPQRLVHLPARF
jgi:hypothetical protein